MHCFLQKRSGIQSRITSISEIALLSPGSICNMTEIIIKSIWGNIYHLSTNLFRILLKTFPTATSRHIEFELLQGQIWCCLHRRSEYFRTCFSNSENTGLAYTLTVLLHWLFFCINMPLNFHQTDYTVSIEPNLQSLYFLFLKLSLFSQQNW